jgi:stearoyl-CoA desaturase (delta-9 desaturase)
MQNAYATATEPQLASTEILNRHEILRDRITGWSVVILPLVGLVAAGFWIGAYGLSAADIGVFLFFYFLTGLGITVGFHRLFTHRSFHTSQWMKIALAVAGSMAIQGPVIRWAADHRRHHAYSDQPGDPHSPHANFLDEEGAKASALRRLWYAHISWFFDAERTVATRYVPDLLKDPAVVTVDRLFPLWLAASALLPALLGWALTGAWQGAVSGLLIGGGARICIVNQVTWAINSVCHYFGKRPYQTGDFSTNAGWLALFTFGEAWHNNHHAFPGTAFFGHRLWQVDLGGILIGLLEKLGLVWKVQRAKAK